MAKRTFSCVNLATKNHPGGIGDLAHRKDPPVAGRIQNAEQLFSIKMLLDHLHPNQPALVQRPRKCVPKRDRIRFANAPIGKNWKMMQSTSEKCELLKVYTNHCVRATTVHRLSASGTPDRHIKDVTGHRNAMSLHSCSKSAREQQQKMISVLDATATSNNSKQAAASTDLDQPPASLATPGDQVAKAALPPVQFIGSNNTCNITINITTKKNSDYSLISFLLHLSHSTSV